MFERRRQHSGPKGLETRPEYIYADEKHFTWNRWIYRKIYLIIHALFAAFWFYFIPFISIIMSYRIPYSFNKYYYTSVYGE